jgi:hypothetical protein
MQFNVRYSENGRADTAQLAGFPNLGQVAHTGCRRVPCQPEYQNRPCGITDNAWRRTTNVVLPWAARLIEGESFALLGASSSTQRRRSNINSSPFADHLADPS